MGPDRRAVAVWRPYAVKIRELEVIATSFVTPRMFRVTLGGPGAIGFESHVPDEHIKLIFPDADGTIRAPVPDGDRLNWPDPFPTTREYTVRRFDAVRNELDIDFVVHSPGLASDWALAARPGDTWWVAGPPSGVFLSAAFDFLVLLGDETALPAIARWLEELPSDARGVVGIEVADAAERQDIIAPAGIAVTWLFRDGIPPGRSTQLVDFAASIHVPQSASPYVWVSGEAGSIKPMRRWVRDELGLGKGASSITGYWKAGFADTHEHLDEDDEDEAYSHELEGVPVPSAS